MLLIFSDNTDVYFNLAAEDYLLHNFQENVVMFWRSNSAVVCGKHQNICAEVNYGFCKTHNIQIARRLTGGGTVYHDLGNINFTFIQNLNDGLEKAVNFKQFLDPIKEALLHMGIAAEYSNRNDLLLNGKKISGNAEHVLQKQKRVLHHGTLLFDADLTHLKEALHPTGIYTDKAVKSVRSVVTNIQNEHSHFSRNEFLANLYDYWLKQAHTNRYVFTEKDLLEIEKTQFSKYSKLDWIVHYSPKYSVVKTIKGPLGYWNLEVHIAEGIIKQMQLNSENPQIVSILGNINTGNWVGQKITEHISLEFAWATREISDVEDPYILF